MPEQYVLDQFEEWKEVHGRDGSWDLLSQEFCHALLMENKMLFKRIAMTENILDLTSSLRRLLGTLEYILHELKLLQGKQDAQQTPSDGS